MSWGKIFGIYTGLAYLTPILGGYLADRVLGKRRTVLLGAITMAAGHFLMAFEVSFLFALLCLVLGSGMFKGNIASQVGSRGQHTARVAPMGELVEDACLS